jgi:hypothetical protein
VYVGTANKEVAGRLRGNGGESVTVKCKCNSEVLQHYVNRAITIGLELLEEGFARCPRWYILLTFVFEDFNGR